jgi:arylsulfatase
VLRAASAAALALLLPLAAGCELGVRPSTGAGRGLVVIAVDGLRADHLSCLGYDRMTTPRLDRWADDGVLFEAAFSAAPLRVPAHSALLSGSDPNLARREVPQWLEATLDQTWLLPPRVPRLPLELAGLGFQTAAFSAHPEFSRVFGLGVGFQTFVTPWEQDGQIVPAAQLLGLAQQWIESQDPGADWFCYLELADLERALTRPEPAEETRFAPRPELGYLPPVGTERPALFALPPERFDGSLRTVGEFEARYDGALFELDQAIGRWLDVLAAEGRLERTSLCLVGSYGMQFGEAGLYADHGRLSMADLRIPVLILPAAELSLARRGRRPELFSAIDLAPTLLGLYGAPAPAGMIGADRLAAAAAPREHCFSSCAIQGGYAAISENHCLELVLGAAVASPTLRRAWYGDLAAHVGEARERLYDWRATPFPPLAGGPPPEPLLAEPLRAAAARYIDAVEQLRELYQEPLMRLGFADRAALESTPP